jgi:hypothetical protein
MLSEQWTASDDQDTKGIPQSNPKLYAATPPCPVSIITNY